MNSFSTEYQLDRYKDVGIMVDIMTKEAEVKMRRLFQECVDAYDNPRYLLLGGKNGGSLEELAKDAGINIDFFEKYISCEQNKAAKVFDRLQKSIDEYKRIINADRVVIDWEYNYRDRVFTIITLSQTVYYIKVEDVEKYLPTFTIDKANSVLEDIIAGKLQPVAKKVLTKG